MTHRRVLIWPEATLTEPSTPVEKVDDSVRALIKDLIDTMEYEGDAAGLAAPQIGVNKRVFVANILPEWNDGKGTNGFQAFINPEFLLKEGKTESDEGCLSIPGDFGPVKRAKRVIMRYLDEEGHTQEIDAVDYLAVCLQHENDHLDGILWIDYQSRLRKGLVRKKMLKLIEQRNQNTKKKGPIAL